MKELKIKWQRFLADGETCPRCGSTEKELEKAVSTLKQSLNSLNIEVVLEKHELTETEFKRSPLQSNRIWFNNRPLEELINGKVGQSRCCDVCDPADCRTTEVGGQIYETVPADLIIKAGLIAASQLVDQAEKGPCCG